MKRPYAFVWRWPLLCMGIFSFLSSEAQQVVFPDCTDTIISLCVADEGVRLPLNNQLYLGDEDPNASSCSVHIRKSIEVKVDSCQVPDLTYEVKWKPVNSSNEISLVGETIVQTDTNGVAILVVDTEFAIDSSIRRNGLPYANGCDESGELIWRVISACAQEEKCMQKIRLYDCQAPVVEELSNPYRIVWSYSDVLIKQAKQFLGPGKDDCGNQNDLLFSFSNLEYIPDSAFTCYDILAFGVVYDSLDIWIADAGTDLNCDGIVQWAERVRSKMKAPYVHVDFIGLAGKCTFWMPHPEYSGHVKTVNQVPVPNVEIQITFSYGGWGSRFTNELGSYVIVIQDQYEVTITPEKNDNPKAGVNIIDLVRLNYHLRSIRPLDAYGLIAADVDDNQRVSAFDMVEIRKLILNTYSSFPGNTSWRFVPALYQFPNPNQPWSYPQEISFTTPDSVNLDFIGIKIGDLNNTVIPGAQSLVVREDVHKTELSAPEIHWRKGEKVEIPVYSKDLNHVLAFQFTFQHPSLRVTEITSDILDIEDEAYAIFEDHTNVCWFAPDPIQLDSDEPLFVIHATAMADGKLSGANCINSLYTPAEIYSGEFNGSIPRLVVESNISGFNCMLPYPNPFVTETTLPVSSETDEEVQLMLFDAGGKLLSERAVELRKGLNEISITATDLNGRGVFFYELKSATQKQTGKLVLID